MVFDNIIVINYEVGIKGCVNDYFDISVVVFNIEFEDFFY